jgi:hypothetical protein
MKPIFLAAGLLLLAFFMGCSQQATQQQMNETPPAMNETGTMENPAMNGSGVMNESNGTMENPAMNESGEAMNGSTNGSGTTEHPAMNDTMNQSGATNDSMEGSMNDSGGTMEEHPAGNDSMMEGPQAFTIEADDSGFYIDGQSVSTIDVNKGDVLIVFMVRSTGVYHSGLDFRGCGAESGGTPPGGSADFTFSTVESCGITSYWPSTGVAKKTLNVRVS